MHPGIRKSRGDVVERREPDSIATQEQGVVLCVCVRSTDEPVEDERVNHSGRGLLRGARGHCDPQEAKDGPHPRSSFTLVFRAGMHRQCLAEILLVNPHDHAIAGDTVISGHDERGLVLQLDDRRARSRQPKSSSRKQAEMLVDLMVVESIQGWLEDVCCWAAPVGTPQRSPSKRSAIFACAPASENCPVGSDPSQAVRSRTSRRSRSASWRSVSHSTSPVRSRIAFR